MITQSQRKDKVKVCVVGCGVTGTLQHIPAWKKIKNALLVGVCDEDVSKLKRASEMHNIKNCYTNIEEMINHEKPDIVDICTPPFTHKQLAILAMKAGCHTIVQKPMALNAEDCEEMIKCAQSYGVKLSVMHNLKFMRPYREAKKLVDKCAIGSLIKVCVDLHIHKTDTYVTDTKHWCHSLPGGVAMELLPHPLYLLKLFCGSLKVKCVHVRKSLIFPHISFTNLKVVLGNNQVDAELYLSLGLERKSWLITDVFGSTADLRLIGDNIMIKLPQSFGPIASISTFSRAFLGGLIKSVYYSSGYRLGGHYHVMSGTPPHNSYGHYIAAKKFVEAVLYNKEGYTSPDEGLWVVRTANEIIEMAGLKPQGRSRIE